MFSNMIAMLLTLFSPLESEVGLCFCLEVEAEDGRDDGTDEDFRFSMCCGSFGLVK